MRVLCMLSGNPMCFPLGKCVMLIGFFCIFVTQTLMSFKVIQIHIQKHKRKLHIIIKFSVSLCSNFLFFSRREIFINISCFSCICNLGRTSRKEKRENMFNFPPFSFSYVWREKMFLDFLCRESCRGKSCAIISLCSSKARENAKYS